MRRGLFLLPLLALLLLPTACGSSDKAADVLDLDPVASAATLTSDAGSARMGFAMAMKMDSRTVKVLGSGIFDFDEHRGAITMDASSLLPLGSKSGNGKFEIRMVGSKIYMRLPAALSSQGLPGVKPWIGIDVEKSLDALGLGGLDPANMQQDPTQTLQLLRASSTSVEKAGTATIRGVATTRYTAKLDLQKSLAAAGDKLGLSDEERAQLQKTMKQLTTQSGLKTIPIEIFVDREGLLRRLKMTMKANMAARSFAMTQTTDFYDFGVDVDIDAPPESEVTDLTGLMQP